MKNTYTHIEEAIEYYKSMCSYEPEYYIELICDCIGYSDERIGLFCNILNKATMEDTKLYYQKGQIEQKELKEPKGPSDENEKSPQRILGIYTNPSEETIEKLGLLPFEDLENKIKAEIQTLPRELQKTRIEVLIKALFLTESILPNTSIVKYDYEKLIETLERALKREGDIKLIIQYSLLKADPSLLNRIVLKKSITFFYHLAKSILNGEYLILQNYSSLITASIKSIDLGDENVLPIVHFHLEKSYIYFANSANEMCYRIERILENKPSNHINLEINNNNPESSMANSWGWVYIGKEVTRPFEQIIKSIINMTIIDHAYKTKDRNILDLLTLREQIKSLKLHLSVNKGYIEDNDFCNFQTILSMVQIKMSNILFRMLNQKQNDEDLELDYYFTFGGETQQEINTSLVQYIISDNIVDSNPFIKTRKDHFNREITSSEEKELINLFTSYCKMKDVNTYNKYVREGIKSYCKISAVMEKISNDEDEIAMEHIIEISDREIRALTPSLFVKAIKYVTRHIPYLKTRYSDKDQYLIKLNLYLQTLSKLLDKLELYISQFSKSVPYRYLPPFEYSFYEIDTDLNIKFSKGVFEKRNGEEGRVQIITYNKEDFKNKFFFASVGCTSMNFEYLRRFSGKYNAERRKYSRDYYKLVDDRIKTSIEESKAQTAKMMSLETKYMEDATEQRHQTMQILGIFAAFLAFVTITVGLIKVATTVHEFLLFCTAFTLSLLLFATHLRNYTRCKKNEEKSNDKPISEKSQSKASSVKECCKFIRNFFTDYALIIFLALMLFIILYFIPIKEDKRENNPASMEQTLIIDRNNAHNSTYNNQSNIESNTKGDTYNN